MSVAEIKSNTPENDVYQVRHGLKQVLDYAHRLTSRGFAVQPILVLESAPADQNHWLALCERHGVELAWVETLTDLKL